jgi:NAD(P)H dehydrogenase (quinone)
MERLMKKVLVLYYSAFGHVEAMAEAMAKGVANVPGVEVTLKRVPETVSPDITRRLGFKANQTTPEADPKQLAQYDAIIFGTPAKSGNMAAQMRHFLDAAESSSSPNAFVGKFASVFTSTDGGTGQEKMVSAFWRNLAHQGMVIVGLPHGLSRASSDLALADIQGRHVATLVARLRD